ncbi:hypothetical protein, partial [Thermaurantiacus sp.]
MAGTEGGVGRPAVPGARTPDIGIKADKLGSITEGRARVLRDSCTLFQDPQLPPERGGAAVHHARERRSWSGIPRCGRRSMVAELAADQATVVRTLRVVLALAA